MSGPLTGVTVLDLSRLLPGPYATRQLAALGAKVIKVEDPAGGDYARWFPPVSGDPPMGGIFRELNEGKLSVALDLKQKEAIAALNVLVAGADVLVDSFRPGVLDRLGFSPSALMSAHPRLIYCAITGFGLYGPDALRAGHDVGYMARAGALDLCGPAEAPVMPGIQVADVGSALAALAGIMAALYARERSGRGQVVDISLVESAQAFAVSSYGQFHGGDPARRGQGLLDGSRPCYGVYPTKSGFLAVGALEPKFWQAFLQVIGLPELGANGLDLGESGAATRARVEARLREFTRDEWMARFSGVEACVEPVLDLSEAQRDAHLSARHAFTAVGSLANPIRVAPPDALERPAHGLSPAPALGAHTEAVLREAGVPEAVLGPILARLS